MSIQQSEAICKQCGEEIKMDGLEPSLGYADIWQLVFSKAKTQSLSL